MFIKAKVVMLATNKSKRLNSLNGIYYVKLLKINPNNTINSKTIKDSFTREKVIELITKAIIETNQSNNRNVSISSDIWIKENL